MSDPAHTRKEIDALRAEAYAIRELLATTRKLQQAVESFKEITQTY